MATTTTESKSFKNRRWKRAPPGPLGCGPRDDIVSRATHFPWQGRADLVDDTLAMTEIKRNVSRVPDNDGGSVVFWNVYLVG